MRGEERRQRAMLVVFDAENGCPWSIRSYASSNWPMRR